MGVRLTPPTPQVYFLCKKHKIVYNGVMDNDNYISLNEQGLAEVSPTTSRDAQLAFIDTLRQTQAENTAQIGEQAHALGSDLTAQYGGLHGPSEYWKSRYQTPQTESRVAGLRTAAQLTALNQLMQNDLARTKERYNQAYRNYNKRQQASSGGSGGTSSSTSGDGETPDVNVIGGLTPQDTLGNANAGNATYGTTVMPTGGHDSQGRPFYKEYANDANGNPTNTVVREYTSEGISGTYSTSQSVGDLGRVGSTISALAAPTLVGKLAGLGVGQGISAWLRGRN